MLHQLSHNLKNLNPWIKLALFAYTTIVFLVFVIVQVQVFNATPDVYAQCNLCYQERYCAPGDTAAWEQGYRDGCLNDDGSRNDIPDVDNDGDVQEGNKGVGGHEEGDNVGNPDNNNTGNNWSTEVKSVGDVCNPNSAEPAQGGCDGDDPLLCLPCSNNVNRCMYDQDDIPEVCGTSSSTDGGVEFHGDLSGENAGEPGFPGECNDFQGGSIYYCLGDDDYSQGCSDLLYYRSDSEDWDTFKEEFEDAQEVVGQCGAVQFDYKCGSGPTKFASYVNTTNCQPAPVGGTGPQEPPQEPPQQPPQEPPETTAVQCNDLCGDATNNVCPGDLTCHNLGNESRCRLPANLSSETCQLPPDNPGIDVIKELTSTPQNYQVGDLAQFRITIENTGDTALTNVDFEDTYNTSHLDFINLEGSKAGGASKSLLGLPGVTVDELSGVITINNLVASDLLGVLNVGQEYHLDMNFLVKGASDDDCTDGDRDLTCNYGEASSNGEEDGDNACLCSDVINTDL